VQTRSVVVVEAALKNVPDGHDADCCAQEACVTAPSVDGVLYGMKEPGAQVVQTRSAVAVAAAA
jgi:hypothetical protein